MSNDFDWEPDDFGPDHYEAQSLHGWQDGSFDQSFDADDFDLDPTATMEGNPQAETDFDIILNPVKSRGGHCPDPNVGSIDYRDNGIFQTDVAIKDMRPGQVIGAYQQRAREFRDMERMLDPGGLKMRDIRRRRSESDYNLRKLREKIRRERREEGKRELSDWAMDLVVEHRLKEQQEVDLQADFREFVEQSFGLSKRRANEILEELDGTDATSEAYAAFQSATSAGWASKRQQRENERLNLQASRASAGIKRPALFGGKLRAALAEDTETFLASGGEITRLPNAEDSWSPEVKRRMKYRWLRTGRW